MALALAAASFSSHAVTNYNSGTGILVIPDVSVDGKNFYNSVTLQLDFSTGTFKLLSYTPKNTAISDTPLQTYSSNGFTVDFMGCAQSGYNEITCYTNVTNNGNDTALTVYGYSVSKVSQLLVKIPLHDLHSQ